MSENLDWTKLKGADEPTPTAPSHTRPFTEKLFPPKEEWESLKGVPSEEKPTGVKLKEGIKETVKAPFRIAAHGLATGGTAGIKGIGGLLQFVSKMGAQRQPGDIVRGKGTDIIRGVGEYIQGLGERDEAFLKSEIEKFMGKPYGNTEKALLGWMERSANIFGQFPSPTMIFPSITGGFMGQLGKELGFSEKWQTILEMTGMMGRDAYKGIMQLFKDKNTGAKIASFLKRNPKATGKVLGLSKTQAEIFDTLSEAEQAKYITQRAETEAAIRSGAAAETKAAQLGEQVLGEEAVSKGTPLGERKITAGGEKLEVKPPKVKVAGLESQTEGLLGKVSPAELGEGKLTKAYTDPEGTLLSGQKKTTGPLRKAGKMLKEKVMEIDKARYESINKLYKISEKLNEGITATHPGLVENLQSKLEKINKVPDLSAPEKEVVSSIETIIKRLSDRFRGKVVQLRPIENQTLINQIKSIRYKLDYDFTHGSPRNIFNPLIKDLEKGIIAAATKAKKPGAIKAWRNASNEYRKWAQEFRNDYINPYRDTTNFDYETLLKKNLDPDNFNVVKNIVGETTVGKEVLGGTQRQIVEKKLAKFIEKPALVRSREFRKAIKELESTLSPKQIESVKKEMESLVPTKLRERLQTKKVTPPRDIKKEIEVATKEIKGVAKYSGKTEAEIEKLGQTPRGIQTIKKDLSRTKNGKDLFDKFAKRKIDSVLGGDKIIPDFSPKNVFNRLNDRKNFDIISALTSPEEARAALEMSKKLANKKLTKAQIAKLFKFYGKYKLLHFLFL